MVIEKKKREVLNDEAKKNNRKMKKFNDSIIINEAANKLL